MTGQSRKRLVLNYKIVTLKVKKTDQINLMFNFFTKGGSPYPSFNGQQVIQLLRQGYRMPRPRHVDNAL